VSRLPVIETLDELVELVQSQPGLYVRWSRGPEVDAHRTSRDDLTGAELSGLCANPLDIEEWWPPRLGDEASAERAPACAGRSAGEAKPSGAMTLPHAPSGVGWRLTDSSAAAERVGLRAPRSAREGETAMRSDHPGAPTRNPISYRRRRLGVEVLPVRSSTTAG
jgi:hypothetical protein